MKTKSKDLVSVCKLVNEHQLNILLGCQQTHRLLCVCVCVCECVWSRDCVKFSSAWRHVRVCVWRQAEQSLRLVAPDETHHYHHDEAL